MKSFTQVLCLLAILLGSLALVVCLGAPDGHPARQLLGGLPIVIAGGLIGLAISAQDDK